MKAIQKGEAYAIVSGKNVNTSKKNILKRKYTRKRLTQSSKNTQRKKAEKLTNSKLGISQQARRLLLDPAVHEEFTRLKNLVEEKDKKVKELQDNIAAVNFTPQSKMGKMLMAKCKILQEENEEIGNQASEGKMQELASKLSLQKHQNAELKSQFEGLQKHMDGLTNDVERSSETVLMLQGKMEEKDQEIQKLKDELQQKRCMKNAKTDIASNKKDSDEMVPREDAE